MITETEPVKAALDELRQLEGGEPIEFADLVIRGAKDKVRELEAESEETRRAIEDMVEWIRTGNGPKVDLKAAEEVKYLGLVARYEDDDPDAP
ncbi:MAG: hypothetical protein WBL45_12435 [Solirubrobacterales bacterium]